MEQEPQIVLDLTGQPLPCTNKAALEWFNKGVVAYVSVREDALPYFEKALQLDDSLVLVHSMLVSACASCRWPCLLNIKHYAYPRLDPSCCC